MKIDSPKSIIFPEGNARGEYDIRSYSKIREITIVITVTYAMKRRLNNEPICTCTLCNVIKFVAVSRFFANYVCTLHAGEGNMKIDSPKSIIFPEGNARGEYDIRG
jgi:hypothetical protein